MVVVIMVVIVMLVVMNMVMMMVLMIMFMMMIVALFFLAMHGHGHMGSRDPTFHGCFLSKFHAWDLQCIQLIHKAVRIWKEL